MAVSDEARIRELAELIRSKGQQIRQQPPGATVTSASSVINVQPQQEVRRRLKEVVVRLHEDVRDNSLSGIQQRLQYTAGKFGLSFSVQRVLGHSPICYMSCESFYMEVCLEDTGTPVSTKLFLGQEPQNSDILTELLKQRDYPSFEGHIRALVDMFNQYQVQDKSKAHVLLQIVTATEQILMNMYKTSRQQYGPLDTILICPFGLLTPRQAGNPMSLLFYITPLESVNSKALDKYSPDSSTLPESLGVSAKVLVERSIQQYKLPIDPNLFDVAQSSFVQLTDQNTISVPLTLVLCLTKDIPICTSIMIKVQQTVYGGEQGIPSLPTPHVNELILQENKENNGANPNNHVIYLPGQVHTYTGLSLQGGGAEVEPEHRGVLLPNRKVPFTHPNQVISIIQLLRQQLVYNTLFKSCLQRKKLLNSNVSLDESFEDFDFKIVTKPPTLISVTTELLSNRDKLTPIMFEFIVPSEMSLHPTHPRVQITINNDTRLDQSQTLNQVLARCLSIPVTIHTVFSHSSILPPLLTAVIKEHQDSLHQFQDQLTCGSGDGGSGNGNSVYEYLGGGMMEVSHDDRTLSVAGMKRKRT